MVVAYHAGLPVPGGFVGVDVFFVISGFVITAMLMREWDSTGRLRLGRFYIRRFKRLTPALALMVAVVMVPSSLLLSPLGGQQTAAKTAIGAMLLAANVVIAATTGNYFADFAESNPLLHTWSLSVEEQFYLVFPMLLLVSLLLGGRAFRSSRTPLVMVGLVGVVSFAFAIAGSAELSIPSMPNSLVGFYSPATRAWEFAVGSLLAFRGTRLRSFSPKLAVAGAAMLVASLCLITEMTPFPGLWTLLPVVGTVLLIAAGGSDGVVDRVLSSRRMVAIGDRSYSIYLWHWPFVVFAKLLWPGVPLVVLAAAALSVLPAYASYRWVEEPIRALPFSTGLPLARLVAVTVIPPLALAGTLGLAVSNGFWDASVQKYQAATLAAHAGDATGCTREAWRDPAKCTWNRGATRRPIYLVGDSNADQFSEALIGAAKSASRPMVGLTEQGCPYLPASLDLETQELTTRCGHYSRDTQAYLQTVTPGLVIIANSYIWFRDSRRDAAVGIPGQAPSQDPRAKLEALSSGLSAAVRSLQGAGHTVLLVQAIPHWGDQKTAEGWNECSALELMTKKCSSTMSIRDATSRQGAAADVVNVVARGNGIEVLDLSSELCSSGTCSSVAPNGMIRYSDSTHITVPQSEALIEPFTKAIATVEP